MEDSLKFAVGKLAEFRDKTIGWRSRMNDEIETIKNDMFSEIASWHSSVPVFVQMAYQDSGFCVPVFIELLRLTNYPDAEQLFIDLSGGFKLTGDIPSGVGWPPSTKRGPTYSWKEFYADNDEFITKRLSRLGQAGPVSPEAQASLLKELIIERELGKVRGPFAAPEKWGVQAHLPEGCGQSLHPAPDNQDCYPSIAFPIDQQGSDGRKKIRRGEDWKRSFHNRLAQTSDKPAHHTVDYYLQGARILHSLGFKNLQLWGHDHEGAYRQFPARPQHLMWAVLEGEGHFPSGSIALWSLVRRQRYGPTTE